MLPDTQHGNVFAVVAGSVAALRGRRSVSTILDVAKLADVSIATVSRVINGDAAVRPRTRRLVEEAITTLDYRPNAAARSLRLARSQTLGLLITDLGNPVYIDVVHGIEDVARAHGYALFLCDAANDAEVANVHLERLYERRVDGLIVYLALEQPPALSLFRDSSRPVVAMGPRAARSGFPAVLVGEIEATVEAIRRVIALGHRRVAIVLRDVPAGRFRYRTEPVRRELEAAGIAWDAGLVLTADDGEACRAVVGAALARPNRPTALIVGTHSYTPWALQAVNQAGLRIPDDLSVLAYGDSAWAAAYQPPLTVVHIDYARWGREAATLLMQIMEPPSVTPPTLTLRAEVIERGSLGPAPDRLTPGPR